MDLSFALLRKAPRTKTRRLSDLAQAVGDGSAIL
jgi:hypothetical protein